MINITACRRHYRGFSLIELLITITIISLLAVTSYTTYTRYIIRTHRAAAKSALMDLALAEEQYYLKHHRYTDKLSDLSRKAIIADGRYYLQIDQATGAYFALSATPKGPQQTDTDCGTLATNSIGQHTSDGITPTENCWLR